MFILFSTARNAVIVVITAGVAAIFEMYDVKGLTLTGKIEPGMPIPALPKFTLVDHVNGTVVRNTGEIFAVS